jgi:phosphoglycolate phosphatase-like HAD superfamily hydrolase
MATLSPHESTLDERTRKAWGAYREAIVELEGRAYETAETEAWERLQELLRDIETDRAALHTDAAHDA